VGSIGRRAALEGGGLHLGVGCFGWWAAFRGSTGGFYHPRGGLPTHPGLTGSILPAPPSSPQPRRNPGRPAGGAVRPTAGSLPSPPPPSPLPSPPPPSPLPPPPPPRPPVASAAAAVAARAPETAPCSGPSPRGGVASGRRLPHPSPPRLAGRRPDPPRAAAAAVVAEAAAAGRRGGARAASESSLLESRSGGPSESHAGPPARATGVGPGRAGCIGGGVERVRKEGWGGGERVVERREGGAASRSHALAPALAPTPTLTPFRTRTRRTPAPLAVLFLPPPLSLPLFSR
jgi:hypothetical protein